MEGSDNRLAAILRALAVTVIVPATLIALWHVSVAREWIPSSQIPKPLSVLDGFIRLGRSGELFAHIKVSALRVLFGFLIGAAFGLALGTWAGASKLAHRALSPTLQVLLPIPPTAWIPLLIILLDIGEASKVALIATGVFGVVYVNTTQGIRDVDSRYVDVASLYKKSPRELVFLVLLPSAVPQILTGFRVALGLSWILLIASEMVASKMVSPAARLEGLGLGWLIFDARRFGRPEDMIVGMLTIGLLGKVTDMILASLQRRLLSWKTTFSGS